MTRTRLLTLLAIPLCLALLLSVRSRPVAAGGSDPGSLLSHATDIVVVTEADSGKQVFAQVGQIIELRLDANPSTGYMWDLTSLDGTALVVADRFFQSFSGQVGADGTETIRLRALRTAKMYLNLAYHRSWETGKAPLRTFSIDLLVREGSGGLTEQAPPVVSALPVATPSSSIPPLEYTPQDPTLPSSFDWRTLGGMTPIKDQGLWPSCEAFALTAVEEGALKVQAHVDVDLSERYLYVNKFGRYDTWDAYGDFDAGPALEAECPYEGMPYPCPRTPPLHHPYRLDYWSATPNSVDAIKQAIYRYGPVKVSMCVGPAFNNYRGGVFETDESAYCEKPSAFFGSHAVALVGWDDSKGTGGVWILRNSWGDGWGDHGYMEIGYGISDVGRDPLYAVYDAEVTWAPLSRLGGEDEALMTVSVESPFAYVGIGSRLGVLDIANASHPALVGMTEPISGAVTRVEVSDQTAYVVSGGGLFLFDVSVPSLPRLVGQFTEHAVRAVAVDGTHVYTVGGDRMIVLDASDPAHPRQLGLFDLPREYCRTGFQAPLCSITGIALQGRYVYLVSPNGGLSIVDVSDPTDPVQTSQNDLPGLFWWAADVAVQGEYAYVVSGGGFAIFDVSDPTDAIPVSSSAAARFPVHLVVVGQYVYVADQSDLRIFDVSSPHTPIEIGEYTRRAWALAVEGDRVYIASQSNCLYIVDATTPSAPLPLGSYCRLQSAAEIAVTGDQVFVSTGDQLLVLDASDRANPRQIGVYDLPYGSGSMVVSSRHVYIETGPRELQIVDCSHPSRPVLVATYHPWDWWIADMTAQGRYLYILSSGNVLEIVDVAEPQKPHRVGLLPYSSAQGFSRSLKVVGGLAYILYSKYDPGAGSLHILNIEDPVHPAHVSSFDTFFQPQGMDVAGHYVYIVGAGGPWGASGPIVILDVSDAAHPLQVFSGTVGSFASDVSVMAGLAFVTTADGLYVFGVTEPERATFLGIIRFASNPFGGEVSFSDTDLFVRRGPGGLSIIRPLWDGLRAYVGPQGGKLSSKSANATFSFAPGAFSEEVTVTYLHHWADAHNGTLQGVGRTFTLEARCFLSGLPVQLSQPYSAVISYTLPSGIKESTLALYHWDGVQWTREAASALDTATGRITASLDHFGLFAVLGEAMTPTPAPTSTPTITPTVTPTPAWQLRLPIVFKP